MEKVAAGLVLGGGVFLAWGVAGSVPQLAVFGVVLLVVGIMAGKYA